MGAIDDLWEGKAVPIENIVGRTSAGMHRWARAHTTFIRGLGRDRVAAHKARLGRQEHTFTGSEYRYWIWSGDGWIVMVGRRGVEFSVPADSTVRQAWARWRAYRSLFRGP